MAREFWFRLFAPIGLAGSVPRQNEGNFANWWRKTMKRVEKEHRRGVNSLIILGAWIIWKHRNACVFKGVAPSVTSIIREFKDEHSLWCLAGAKKLQGLELGGRI